MSDEARIHVDDDWKAEARREKERLASEVEARDPAEPREVNFAELVNLLAMQAMVGLGGLSGPGGQSIPPNPEIAKHYIDLLDILDQKTKNNLTDPEKRIIDTTLYNLRMAYVEFITALSEARQGQTPTPPDGQPPRP
ncbi:MAG: DUF1844 domain-containing protein [Phycisphaerae bacterium]|nr:DUF1844 domain-containing protein [Phycisphaerae bacterium]